MNEGGKMLKDVPKGNKGLGKLPKSVRNDIGFKKDGGMMPKKKKMMYGGMMSKKKKMMYGGMMSKKKKMMDGGMASKERYGVRPADTSLVE